MKWDQRWKFFPKWPIFFIIVINKTIKEFATYLFSMHIWPKCGDWRRFGFLQVTLTVKFNLAANPANRGAVVRVTKMFESGSTSNQPKSTKKKHLNFFLQKAPVFWSKAPQIWPLQQFLLHFYALKFFNLTFSWKLFM